MGMSGREDEGESGIVSAKHQADCLEAVCVGWLEDQPQKEDERERRIRTPSDHGDPLLAIVMSIAKYGRGNKSKRSARARWSCSRYERVGAKTMRSVRPFRLKRPMPCIPQLRDTNMPAHSCARSSLSHISTYIPVVETSSLFATLRLHRMHMKDKAFCCGE